MVNFLGKIFIKDYTNYEDAKVRESYGKLGGTVGIISNLILFIAKLIIGIISGSIAITVDAVNNLSDSISSIITLVGFKIAGKPADEDHPYGHARTEYIATLFISIMVLLVGVEFFQSSIKKIIAPEITEYSVLMIVILLISVFIKFLQGNFNLSLSKKISSQTLKATATDSFNDIIITVGVVLSVLIEALTGFRIDGYTGLLISLYVMYSGYELIKDTVDELIGKGPDLNLIVKITKELTKREEIVGYHELLIHDYGPGKKFGSVHAEVIEDDNFLDLHATINELENEILEKFDVDFVIHIDPVEIDSPEVNLMKGELEEELRHIDSRLVLIGLKRVKTNNHKSYLPTVKVQNDKVNGVKLFSLKNKIEKSLHKTYPDYEFSVNMQNDAGFQI